MVIQSLQHRRAHNLLLISKLLNCRETASPFTLIFDSLEQSAKPLLREFIRRANLAKTSVVYVSFETLRRPAGVESVINARGKALDVLHKEIVSCASKLSRTLLIFDTLQPIASTAPTALISFLSSLIGPSVSLLATYHSDVPLSNISPSPYSPDPVTLLRYLCTTVLTVHSLSHLAAKKAARDRSLVEPVFGLDAEIEGMIRGIGGNEPGDVVVEMEFRRKSGRGVREWFVLPARSGKFIPRGKDDIILLDDHPLFKNVPAEGAKASEDGETMDTTFNLGLTEKQRRDREGVVLPYFDAQNDDAGPGEGGRILYDMGEEDDFDEEEDEI
ncbi:hypothetical protein L228DRAFT_262405 [Xylona heveae TC161]|uniref:Elongator complex protein 5 n=1 Tax=Xylona heveae (strain CBS 132557 / TC161) TaxID=1328760 RepID=A0A165FU36_XYLHT|nr:hypothetical protein L228DRAFT_262405 [Xylona heveae TC161]KZF21383.1 hypothetical protein L228DRAFT_262405 [Xylona heveae TC161]